MYRRETIEMNHYESTLPSQDVYETLHSKPAETRYRSVEVQQSPHRKKLVFILLAANTLLLGTILVIVAIHYLHVFQPPRFAPNNEEWYLHDNMFYLFWSGQGNCEEAKGFCVKRGAQLLTVDSRNEAWVKSMVRERQVWVQGSPSAGSGVTYEEFPEMFHPTSNPIEWPIDEFILPEYEDLPCDVFPSCTTASGCHGPAGWVCHRACNKRALY